jgi:hypothetical protein
MGNSSYGQIHFGIRFDEGFEFPWNTIFDETDESSQLEYWWFDVIHGYQEPFEIYDERGEYLPGITEAKRKEHSDHRDAFQEAHPLPVELINYCRDECPMYILALPGTGLQASRGNPVAICRSDFLVNVDQEKILTDFCKNHGIDCGHETPKWWLSAYSE